MSDVYQAVNIYYAPLGIANSADALVDFNAEVSIPQSLFQKLSVGVLDNRKDLEQFSVRAECSPGPTDVLLKQIFDRLVPDVSYKDKFIGLLIKKYGGTHFLAMDDDRIAGIQMGVFKNSMYMAPEMIHCREVYAPAMLKAIRDDYQRHKEK